MTGRKPKPAIVKIANGNPGRRPIPQEMDAPGDLTAPPEWLTASQRDAWEYAIANAPEGLLRRLDREVLIAFVVAKDLHQQAAQQIQEQGLTFVTPKGFIMQNPAIGVLNKQAAMMLKAAEQMGFSPVARARVHVASAAPPRDDWEEILSA